MRKLISKFRLLSKKFPYKSIIALILISGGYFVLLLMDYQPEFMNRDQSLCIFKNITDVPCPGCGMGRASLSIFEGDFFTAVYYNILSIPFTVIVFVVIIWLLYDLIRGKDSFWKNLDRPLSIKAKLIVVIVLLVTWVLNIIHGI